MNIRKIALLPLAAAALNSCTFGASIDTLMTPPKLSVEQEQIYAALTDSVIDTSISLKYPKSGKYLSAFIIEDIDGDGENEAVVFYERNNHASEENSLRINILDKDNGKWRSVSDTAAAGAEIEKVMISQLGENERVNLIIGSSLINRSEKNVSIYTYHDNNGEKELGEPTFSDSYSFFDVTDMDMDGQNEFLLLKGSSSAAPATAEAYKLDVNGVYAPYPQDLSGSFTEFDNLSYGNIGGGRTGLYIDAVSGAGSIQTDVIYMNENGLNKVFSNSAESLATVRSSGCTSFDVDGDGTPEIPVQDVADGYEDMAEGEQLKLTSWMQVTENDRLEKKYTSYYSVNDGYIFLFPEKWEGKVTVKWDSVNDEIVFCAYADGTIGRELLRIYRADDQPSRDDRLSGGYMLMHTKGDSAFLALISSAPDTAGDGLTPTAGDAAVGFKFKD